MASSYMRINNTHSSIPANRTVPKEMVKDKLSLFPKALQSRYRHRVIRRDRKILKPSPSQGRNFPGNREESVWINT